MPTRTNKQRKPRIEVRKVPYWPFKDRGGWLMVGVARTLNVALRSMSESSKHPRYDEVFEVKVVRIRERDRKDLVKRRTIAAGCPYAIIQRHRNYMWRIRGNK